MGFIADLFSGSKAYQAQSGLQPGQLGQTYEDQKKAMEQMAAFVAATQPGGAQALAAQQALSTQLGAMGRGEGPSAAQAMIEQQSNQLAAQQAALMGSQRGASQNVGLVGRQAAQAGMQAQQQALGQAAILRQQEQLSALEQLRALSGQQVGQQQTGLGMYGQSALQAQQQALNAQAQQEQARTSMAQQQESTRGGIIGGLLGGLGAAASSGMFGGAGAGKAAAAKPVMIAKGGEVPEAQKDIVSILMEGQRMAHGSKVPGKAKVEGDSYDNDTVPALLSPGEIVVPRSAAKDPEKAAAFAKSVAMRSKSKGKKK
jgi:hypothetical protein